GYRHCYMNVTRAGWAGPPPFPRLAGHAPARKRLTRRSSVTSPGNVLRTRYRPRNSREILPKPAHGTPALQEYVAAGVEPASTLDPEGPLPHGGIVVPYPSWLNAGDSSWQLTAATLVGLMSIPALAVLYGGLVQRKWAVNTMLMTFTAFCTVLIVWVLWVYKMGFGEPWIKTFVGMPGAVIGHGGLQNRAHIPLISGTGGMPAFRFPQSALVYFQ